MNAIGKTDRLDLDLLVGMCIGKGSDALSSAAKESLRTILRRINMTEDAFWTEVRRVEKLPLSCLK